MLTLTFLRFAFSVPEAVIMEEKKRDWSKNPTVKEKKSCQAIFLLDLVLTFRNFKNISQQFKWLCGQGLTPSRKLQIFLCEGALLYLWLSWLDCVQRREEGSCTFKWQICWKCLHDKSLSFIIYPTNHYTWEGDAVVSTAASQQEGPGVESTSCLVPFCVEFFLHLHGFTSALWQLG